MQKIYLVLIIILSALLRLAYLASFPPSLNWDEVSLGYNAYSLIKTGHDEWGKVLPTIFRAFGDYKLPGYIYSAVPGIALLGLNETSVRLPSALAGIGLVVVTYLLTQKIFLDRRISLLSSLLVAISPWGLFLSHVAVEANLGALFVALGICLLVYRRASSGILFLGLSAWTYNSARVFAPLFLLIYLVINRKSLTIKHLTLSIVLLAPVFIQLLQPAGSARFQNIGLLDSGSIARLEYLRNSWSSPFSRFVYNRPVYFTSQFLKNYLFHFNPNFLFIDGGSHYQFNIPHTGLLYLITLPFFYFGLSTLLTRPQKIVLLWLLLAPIPGSLTRDAPHTLRAIIMLPLPMILISLGVVSLTKVRVVNLLLLFLLLVSTINYLLLTNNYRTSYSWAWQYGYKPTIQYIQKNYGNYDQIIFTKRYGEPHEFVLFYWPWSPAAQLSKGWDYHAAWYWVNNLDKFRFVNDWEMPQTVASLPPGQRYLVISSPDNPTSGTVLTQINFLDGKPAFIIRSL